VVFIACDLTDAVGFLALTEAVDLLLLVCLLFDAVALCEVEAACTPDEDSTPLTIRYQLEREKTLFRSHKYAPPELVISSAESPTKHHLDLMRTF